MSACGVEGCKAKHCKHVYERITELLIRTDELEGHRRQWRNRASDLETAFRAYVEETAHCVAASGFGDEDLELAKAAARAALDIAGQHKSPASAGNDSGKGNG